MRHSPEPWKEASTDYLQKQVEIEDRDGTLIAIIPFEGGKLMLSDARENVKVILAAPLLLKAAIMARNWMECDKDKIDDMDPHDREIYTRTMAELKAATNAART